MENTFLRVCKMLASVLNLVEQGQTRFFKFFPALHTLTEHAPCSTVSPKHRLALFFNNASCPLNLEATTQRDALLHPLFSSWVTVGSHVTASCMYLALPAGEEAGNARHSRAALYPMGDNGRRAERQGCAPGHVPHQHIAPRPHCLDRKQPFLSSPSSLCVPALIIVQIQSSGSMLVYFCCKITANRYHLQL